MLGKFISNLLDKRLPIKTKRQVFVASFVALVTGVTTYDQETLGKLNSVLFLSESGEDALAAPVMLSRVIWSGKTAYDVCQEDVTKGVLSADRISNVVANILNSMPHWLRYGTFDEIEKDVTVLLNERIELLGA